MTGGLSSIEDLSQGGDLLLLCRVRRCCAALSCRAEPDGGPSLQKRSPGERTPKRKRQIFGLSTRRRRWCGRFLSLYRPDFDRPRQERAVSIFEIGAAYLIVLVKIVDGRGFAAFGYGRALDDFQNARISSALYGECLRVFVYGGDDSMIRHEQSFWSVPDGGTGWRWLRGRR